MERPTELPPEPSPPGSHVERNSSPFMWIPAALILLALIAHAALAIYFAANRNGA